MQRAIGYLLADPCLSSSGSVHDLFALERSQLTVSLIVAVPVSKLQLHSMDAPDSLHSCTTLCLELTFVETRQGMLLHAKV